MDWLWEDPEGVSEAEIQEQKLTVQTVRQVIFDFSIYVTSDV
jgi:hypothetical protein